MVAKNYLQEHPQKAKLEVPVTYNIGWWAYQDSLTIDSLYVKIEESKLNLINSKSLISYQIAGSIKYDRWLYEIEKVHISEKINTDTAFNYDRIIE